MNKVCRRSRGWRNLSSSLMRNSNSWSVRMKGWSRLLHILRISTH